MVILNGRRWGLLVLPALVLYLVLAWGSGLDRSAQQREIDARLVPAPLRSGVLFAQARQFIDAGIAGSAFAPARLALARDPANPAAPALLGAALAGKRDHVAADRAFRVAARLGWREPLTQLYWFQVSLGQNDFINAVLRFDAIARQHPDAPYVGEMARQLEQTEAGRDALAARMVQGANWSKAYATIRNGTSAERIAARVDVLERVARQGRQLGCEDVVQTARVLAVADPAAGSRMWRQHCPRAATPLLVIDGGFDRPPLADPTLQVPYEWSLAGHGGLDTALVPDGRDGQALQVSSSAAVTVVFLEQLVPAPAGSYRVSWRMPSDAAGQGSRVLASLSCTAGPVLAAAGGGALRGGRYAREVSVPANCRSPWLRFWLAPGSGSVTIDDIRLDPL